MFHYSHLILVYCLSSIVDRCPPLEPSEGQRLQEKESKKKKDRSRKDRRSRICNSGSRERLTCRTSL